MKLISLALFILLLAFTPAARAGQEGVSSAVAVTAVPAATAPATATPVPDAAPAAEHFSAGYDEPTIANEAYIVDYDTGTVLLDKNGDTRMPTSSLSKTMTIYMLFDALKHGQVSLDTKFHVSEKAWRMQGSKMFVELGADIPVEDLIQGIIVQSGNDATIVVAEGLAGSEDEFVKQMNAKAKELGLTNSHFANASGWPEPDHYSTAHDLTLIAHHLIHDFPEYYKYFSEKEFTWHNIHQMNRNPLLFRDIGADGLKTGHSESSGAHYGLMGSGTRDGRRVVMLLNGLESEKDRANEGARLLDWALRDFEDVDLFKAGDEVEKADVAMGTEAQVPLIIEKPLKVTVSKAMKNDLKVTVNYKGPLLAPIHKGDQVGTVKIALPRGGTIERPLLAGADVPRLGAIASVKEKLLYMLNKKLDSAVK